MSDNEVYDSDGWIREDYEKEGDWVHRIDRYQDKIWKNRRGKIESNKKQIKKEMGYPVRLMKVVMPKYSPPNVVHFDECLLVEYTCAKMDGEGMINEGKPTVLDQGFEKRLRRLVFPLLFLKNKAMANNFFLSGLPRQRQRRRKMSKNGNANPCYRLGHAAYITNIRVKPNGRRNFII